MNADDESVDKEMMVREAFHILTQGVEMTHYEANNGFRRSCSVSMKVLWLNPDSLRLCVSKSRPPVVESKVYTGVYLRDVTEVLGGAHTFGFAAQPEPITCHEQCLNIVASERTLCLQLPSEVPTCPLAHTSCIVLLLMSYLSSSIMEHAAGHLLC